MVNIVNARIMLIVTPVCHGALRAPSHPWGGGGDQSGGGKHLFNRRQVLATLPVSDRVVHVGWGDGARISVTLKFHRWTNSRHTCIHIICTLIYTLINKFTRQRNFVRIYIYESTCGQRGVPYTCWLMFQQLISI